MADLQAVIGKLNRELKRLFADYQGVYAYGSRQRGDWGEASDYDLLFVFTATPDWRKKDRIRAVVYQRELDDDIVIDGKYYSVNDIAHPRTPFCETVKQEGAFYAAFSGTDIPVCGADKNVCPTMMRQDRANGRQRRRKGRGVGAKGATAERTQRTPGNEPSKAVETPPVAKLTCQAQSCEAWSALQTH